MIATRRFGNLKLNPESEWFDGAAKWNGKLVRVSFEPDDNDSVDTALDTASELWREQAKWNRQILDYAAAELLPQKNETLVCEEDTPLDEDEFTRQLSLLRICCALEEGEFEFWFESDLFLGQEVVVVATLAEGPIQADVAESEA